jgi:hypothetical protein
MKITDQGELLNKGLATKLTHAESMPHDKISTVSASGEPFTE